MHGTFHSYRVALYNLKEADTMYDFGHIDAIKHLSEVRRIETFAPTLLSGVHNLPQIFKDLVFAYNYPYFWFKKFYNVVLLVFHDIAYISKDDTKILETIIFGCLFKGQQINCAIVVWSLQTIKIV